MVPSASRSPTLALWWRWAANFAGDEEIAEQAQVRRRRRRHVDEEAIERLGLFRRREEIGVVAFADAVRLGGGEDMLSAHDQHQFRP